MNNDLQESIERNGLFVFLILLVLLDIWISQVALTHATTTNTTQPETIVNITQTSIVSIDEYWFRVLIAVKSTILYTCAFFGKSYFLSDRNT